MKKLIVVLVIAFLAIGTYSLVFAGPRGNFNEDNYRHGPRMMRDDYPDGGYYQREEMQQLRDKIYNNFEDMIEDNRDKIRDIMNEKYDLRRDIHDEMEKSNLNWSKISSLMEKNHSLSENIWEIRKDQRLQIMKSLSEEERELYLDHFYNGFHRMGRREGGYRRGGYRPHHMGY